jgi:hypothetical protein
MVRGRLGACAVLASLLLVGGCAAGGGATSSPSSQSTASTPADSPASRSPSASASASASPSVSPTPTPEATPVKAMVTKLMVVVVENHSLDQMRSQMPSTTGLADRYAYADHYTAIRHPSLPNYLAILGGSTFGVTDDDSPAAHRISGPSIFGAALAHGLTARLYAEGMPSPCAIDNGGRRYAVKHNPWAYFVAERNACRASDVSTNSLAADAATGRLPDAGMLVPNLCNDAHDCLLATADRWLRDRLALLTTGPDWTSGRLAIVVTADEDDRNQGNTVLTAVLQRDLRHQVVHTLLTHYSLSRLYAEVLGVAPLREAAKAPAMATAFGLRVRQP